MSSRFSRRSVRRPAIAILCVAAAAITATRSWSRADAERTDPGAPAHGPADGELAESAAGAAGGASPALVFPVAGHDRSHIISRFGDPRDGGRRQHLGIDIAAPTGTPVLAPVNGIVSATDSGGIGGHIVWLGDAGAGRRYYFAHLDAISVAPGQRVRAGEQLGTVGTSGNAPANRPHLHFAIHERSDVLDPWSLVAHAAAREASAGDAATTLMRTRLAGAALRSAAVGGHTVAILPRHQQVSILGRTGDHYRVNVRGRTGFIAEWLLE